MKKLDQLRNQVDKIDEQIQRLLNKRASIALKIGKEKHKDNIKSFYSPERNRQVLRAIVKRNKGPLQNKDLKAIYKIIMNCCLALQQKNRL